MVEPKVIVFMLHRHTSSENLGHPCRVPCQVGSAMEQVRAAQLLADDEYAEAQVPAMELKILPDMVGCIIGKAGSYVRGINRCGPPCVRSYLGTL